MAAAGSTLVELLMVLAVLGISAGVVGVAISATPARPEVDGNSAAIAAARRDALATGRPVVVTLADSSGPRAATALPDGSVVVDAKTKVDRLTGRVARDDP